MELEKLINNMIDDYLERSYSGNQIIIDIQDYNLTEVDDVKWSEIIYFSVIDDALIKSDDLIIRFNRSFTKQHFDNLKKQQESECRDLEREYWSSRL